MPAVPIVPAGVIARVDRPENAPPAAAPLDTAFSATLARATGRVEPARTPRGGEEAASAIASAYQSVTGHAPTAKQLSLLVAQWSLETGGGRSMMNYNFGGIKGSSPGGLSAAYTTKEGYGATERTLVDRFRAYSSPEEGAADYLRTLRARFPKSFDAVRAGDAAEFAHTLKREGYYTGSEADYTRAIAQISDRALTRGFASAGAEDGGAPRAHKAIARGADEADDPQDAVRTLDAMRMADEMSRAALQIAAADGGGIWKGNT